MVKVAKKASAAMARVMGNMAVAVLVHTAVAEDGKEW